MNRTKKAWESSGVSWRLPKCPLCSTNFYPDEIILWFDYINIVWDAGRDKTYVCPSKVKMFLDLRTSRFKRGSTLQKAIYAIIHSTKNDERTLGPTKEAKLIHEDRGEPQLISYWTMEEVYRLIRLETFHSLSYVVEDYNDLGMTNRTPFVIWVQEYNEWGNNIRT